MKHLLYLLLLPLVLRAQQVHENYQAGFSLRYPAAGWQLAAPPQPGSTQLAAGTKRTPDADITVTVAPTSAAERALSHGERRAEFLAEARQLPGFRLVSSLESYSLPGKPGFVLDFYYKSPTAGLMHRVALYAQRGDSLYTVTYQGREKADKTWLATGLVIMHSFAFRPRVAYAQLPCDDKVYGILYRDPMLLYEDMRTLHEYPSGDLSQGSPVVHERALPFEAVALAKGFDNNLYTVAREANNAPQLVYCYRPALRSGSYTSWQLPAQGPGRFWLSGGTDHRGDLYFLTNDAGLLVKINPPTGQVSRVWDTPPPAGRQFFGIAGLSVGNFCFDEHDTLYLLDGAGYRICAFSLADFQTAQGVLLDCHLPEDPGSNVLPPYGDILIQNTAAGERKVYATGLEQTFELSFTTRRARAIAPLCYTDLAGCNIFRNQPPDPPAAAPTAHLATWRGRLLDDSTRQPLPRARLLPTAPGGATVTMDAAAGFTWQAPGGRTYPYEVQLPGYYAVRGSWAATAPGRRQDILLKKLRVGASFTLENVQFQQGTAELQPDAEAALRRLLTLLLEYPAMTIELAGHTDNVGPAAKNQQLSEARVATVRAWLLRQGIAPARLSGRGYGGTQPKADNGQEATRRLNRRVEFTITRLY